MMDALVWWLITHEEQFVAGAVTVGAVGILAVLVGLTRVYAHRVRAAWQFVDDVRGEQHRPAPIDEDVFELARVVDGDGWLL